MPPWPVFSTEGEKMVCSSVPEVACTLEKEALFTFSSCSLVSWLGGWEAVF